MLGVLDTGGLASLGSFLFFSLFLKNAVRFANCLVKNFAMYLVLELLYPFKRAAKRCRTFCPAGDPYKPRRQGRKWVILHGGYVW